MEIELLDGKEYTFKALPFCDESLALMEKMEKEPLRGLLDAITFSLSLTYGKDKAKQIIESGTIPFPKGKNKLVQSITSAIFPNE